MPIREESFRIGCGRYIQGKNYIAKCGEEVLRFGTSPLILCDDITKQFTQGALEDGVRQLCKKYEIVIHNGPCNHAAAEKVAAYAGENGYDVIVGVGGGVIMDYAKLCADYAGVAVVNIPTSSATCAAYAALSVCYTPDGQTVGSKHYTHEVDSVIADTQILANQPIRLLLAGVFDALAKHLEIKQRFDEEADVEYPLGLDYAHAMAKRSYKILNSSIEKCIADMKKGEITFEVENVIFTALAATGAISCIARGSNQCALAHKFYESARTLFPESTKPYLHGEMVGVGLLLQNYYNGEVENNAKLLDLMKQYEMPSSVSEIGVDTSAETMDKFYAMICGSSAVDKDNPEECRKFKESLAYLWSL